MRAAYVVTPFASVAGAALLVAGCGIDQGGYDGPSGAATGQPAQTVVVSGPIEALNSFRVNGLVLDTARAQVRIDGRPASEADLRLGQMIRVAARVEGATAAALTIEYEENVVGPVAAIDLAASEITVLGQRARLTSTTRFDGPRLGRIGDLRIGDRVAVSGIALAGNAVLATYVGRVHVAEPFEVTTNVTALGSAALTFELGALTIDYSRASVLELPGGQPAASSVVEVTGSVLDDGVLVAERVRAVPLLPGTFTAAATALTNDEVPAAALAGSSLSAAAARFVGVVTARNGDSLALGDLQVRMAPATIVDGDAAELVAGARVLVVGSILGPGHVEATRIEIQ